MAQVLQNGTTLQDGKYKIVSFLGQGGFGITYLAENTMLEKKVAVKEFFPKDFCDRKDTSHLRVGTESNRETVEKLKERFLKEARNIAKIDFPGIVKIFDIFKENNTSYYVMEYIEGENLNDIVKKNGPLSEEKAIEYIKGVGEALEHIHSKNMTHFDVKPSNIVIRKSDDKPILIDFGLSKQYNKEGEATSTLLQGVSNGYSPIELYNSDENLTFSPQTDVYSLAATLYYLLEGITPPLSLTLIHDTLSFPISIRQVIQQVILKGMAFKKSERPEKILYFLNSFSKYYINNTALQNIKEDNEETEILDFLEIHDKNLIKKAQEGDPEAQLEIGNIFFYGTNVKIDREKALFWYKKAANQEYSEAQAKLGNIYYLGLISKKDFNEAAIWYQKAANNQNISAMLYLAHMYYKGLGVKKDERKAEKWLNKTGEIGNAQNKYFVGLKYLISNVEDGPVRRDINKAMNWLSLAAQQGEITAQYKLGELFYEGKEIDQDLSQSLFWFLKAAEKGDSEAMFEVGKAYYKGEGTTKNYTIALNWFEKSAMHGYANAHAWIGSMYEYGEGVKKDYVKARKEYLSASKFGITWMFKRLGDIYFYGRGVKKNYLEAINWYEKSAKIGNLKALNILGDMYYKGNGIEKNKKKAIEYWVKAADLGDEIANKKRNSKFYRVWYGYDIPGKICTFIGISIGISIGIIFWFLLCILYYNFIKK